MDVDYLIVGLGLAGISFCDLLEEHGKSFVVFDNNSQQSSTVAAGLYNPVILKRFSEVWKAQEQLELAIPKFRNLEKKLGKHFLFDLPICRRFSSISEQNQWFEAMDNPKVGVFMSPQIIKNDNPYIHAEFGLGKLNQTGRLDTRKLVPAYRDYLIKKNHLVDEAFDYSSVEDITDHVRYNDIKAKRIIFCEGFGLKNNPFFKELPLNGTKGEIMVIKAPKLNLDYILKGSCFIVPEGDDLYSVGATYNWTDKSNEPTFDGKLELIEKLQTLISCDFEVVDQKAGVRPTVKDRRPLIGQHQLLKTLFILNGLGTRGVMIGPYVAQKLFDFIEHNIEIDSEMDINRFSY